MILLDIIKLKKKGFFWKFASEFTNNEKTKSSILWTISPLVVVPNVQYMHTWNENISISLRKEIKESEDDQEVIYFNSSGSHEKKQNNNSIRCGR